MERRKPESREQGKQIVTLADLAPRHDVTGGSRRRVFGADAPFPNARGSQSATASQKTKDLAPKSPSKIKGGRLAGNSSFTLVRIAKPGVTKNLSPSKNPKGGKKQS